MTPGKPSHAAAELLRQLESNDPPIVIKALRQLEKAASIRELPAILRSMTHASNSDVINQYTIFLSNIRSKQAPAVMAEFLTDPASTTIRPELTRACWESQLDYSPYLLLFAHLFIGGDYRLALEAFTVIENTCLERPVHSSLLAEISLLLKNSLPDQPDTMQRLTRELILVLEPFITKG